IPEPLECLIRAGLAAQPDRRPSLGAFVAALRGELNQLLADTFQQPPAREAAAPSGTSLRLNVSRRAGRYTYPPVATPPPAAAGQLRDVRRVPSAPERVDVTTGDRLRLEVEVGEAGYVTAFNVGPTGNLNLLYPADPALPPAAVETGRPLHVLDL